MFSDPGSKQINIHTGDDMNRVSDFNEPTVEVLKSNKEKQGRKSKQSRPKTSNNRARASSQPRANAAPARNTPFTNGNLLSSKPKQVKSRVITNNQSSTRHGDALMAKEYSNYLHGSGDDAKLGVN